MSLVDTHAHLNFEAFNNDYLSVALRNHDLGVEKIIIVGSDPTTSAKAVDISREINEKIPDYAFAAVGIHAVHVSSVIPSEQSESRDLPGFDKIIELASDPIVVAIGESGMDFYHDKERQTEREQIELFKRHIELAIKLDKPLIIHNREADEEVREIVERYPGLTKAVLHCFSSDHNMAKWAIDRGFYLSFTGNITYGNKKIKKAIERTTLDRIMVETDAPYNVPEPLRSQGVSRNEPAYTLEVARKIAQIKNLDLDLVVEQTTKNARRFFNL